MNIQVTILDVEHYSREVYGFYIFVDRPQITARFYFYHLESKLPRKHNWKVEKHWNAHVRESENNTTKPKLTNEVVDILKQTLKSRVDDMVINSD